MRNLTLTWVSCFVLLTLPMAAYSHGPTGIPSGYGYPGNHHYQSAYPAQVFFPLYTTGYQRPTTPDSLAQLDKLDRIAAALEKLAASSPAAAAQAAELRHVQILRANCSSCHNATLKKGGLVLFSDQGQAETWSPEVMTKILDRISRPAADPERMPPGRRLPYDDFTDTTQGLLRASIKQSAIPPGLARFLLLGR